MVKTDYDRLAALVRPIEYYNPAASIFDSQRHSTSKTSSNMTTNNSSSSAANAAAATTTASNSNLNNTFNYNTSLSHAESNNMLVSTAAVAASVDGSSVINSAPNKRSIPMKSAYLFKKGSGKMRKKVKGIYVNSKGIVFSNCHFKYIRFRCMEQTLFRTQG